MYYNSCIAGCCQLQQVYAMIQAMIQICLGYDHVMLKVCVSGCGVGAKSMFAGTLSNA